MVKISEFLANAPLLKLYLEEEASQAKGYIDTLRTQITDVMTSGGGVGTSFRTDVMDSLELRGNMVRLCTTVESSTDGRFQETQHIQKELLDRLRTGTLASDLLMKRLTPL